MAQTVTLQLLDEILQRCQRGATAARKLLEEFLPTPEALQKPA